MIFSPRLPLEGNLDLTYRCNNNCRHCWLRIPPDAQKKKEESFFEEIKSIVSEARSFGCRKWSLSGGEPMLRLDFPEILDYMTSHSLSCSINTNGTLITPKIATLLKRKGAKLVALYGATARVHDHITRTPGSFEATWQGIRLLLDHKIPFVVKGAASALNRNEMKAFERWAATIPWMDKPPSYSMFFDLRCRRGDAAKDESIRKLRVTPDAGVKVLARRKKKYLEEMREFCSKFMRPPGENLFSCGSGHGGCVDSYGQFRPCMALRNPECVYNFKNGSLKGALAHFFPKLRKTKATNPQYLLQCARCFLKGLCEQCPPKSWTEHGTLDTPVEYLSEVAHVQARYLGLIENKEKAWQVVDWEKRIKRFTQKGDLKYGSEN